MLITFTTQTNFFVENFTSLFPRDLDRSVKERILFFHKKISRIPIGAISMGSFIHTDLCSNPKPPFIGITRSSFLRKSYTCSNLYVQIRYNLFFTENDSKISSVLEQYAKVNPIQAENLRKKAEFQEKKRAIFTNRDEFMILINAVDSVLTDIEAELEENGKSL